MEKRKTPSPALPRADAREREPPPDPFKIGFPWVGGWLPLPRSGGGPGRGFSPRNHSPAFKYSSIARAAFLPAPMARITVAAPVTMSPPAKTPSFEVRRVSGSAWM